MSLSMINSAVSRLRQAWSDQVDAEADYATALTNLGVRRAAYELAQVRTSEARQALQGSIYQSVADDDAGLVDVSDAQDRLREQRRAERAFEDAKEDVEREREDLETARNTTDAAREVLWSAIMASV